MMRFSPSNLVILLAVSACTVLPSPAQMLDPAMDRSDEPFCYFSHPTDVIGVMDGKEATLVSPEGFFYTGWGELMLFTGDPPLAVDQRVKTLMKGYLPVIEYAFTRDQIRYAVTAFAATLDGNPESPLVNFIRVRLKNTAVQQRTAWFGAGLRYEGEASTSWGVADNRFGRPAKAKVLGEFEQAGVEFSRNWVYAFEGDLLLRDSTVMYMYPPVPQPTQLMTLKMGYNEPQDLKPQALYVYSSTPVGIVQYRFALKPGEEKVLEFRMPYEPIPVRSPMVAALRAASFDSLLTTTVRFWDELLARGIEISLPEEKVVNTFKANLIYDLIARNKQEGQYIQKVNEFQYDAFWLRDASFITRMYDLSGYHDLARQCLDFFPRWQQADGNFISQGGQYDGWGQTMWAYGQHYRLTHDRKFAQSVYPSMQKAVEWLRQSRKGDPLHLIPVTTPGDNEEITGHVTGHNFWALVGLKNTIAVAEGLGKADDARAYRKDYDDLLATLKGVLKKVTAGKGVIPPGLDSAGGQDWGNMMSVYPEMILPPFDPMVTSTLNATRAKYQEGIMTYGNGRWLHHYLTLKNTETELVRGDQQMAIEELYAVLLHTSATHTGFEYSIIPWGTRDFGMNLSPHGWFSATYRTVIRNMMVREQGSEIHLLSAVSPEWIRDGAVIAVRRAPTNFGRLDFTLRCGAGGATIAFDNEFSTSPTAIVIHIPWFLTVEQATVDGVPGMFGDRVLVVPPGTSAIQFRWKKKPGTPSLNYNRAVDGFKAEYRKRYDAWIKG